MSQPQIEISAQVWVCESCGCHDPKSCACNSAAYSKEVTAAKKEAHRQANRKSYEKTKQNQPSSDSPKTVEITKESRNNIDIVDELEQISEFEENPSTVWDVCRRAALEIRRLRAELMTWESRP